MINCWFSFPRSLTRVALSWFTKIETSILNLWVDLPQFFVEQYKFNTKIAPDREEPERMSKKPNKNFREYAKGWRDEASQDQPLLTDKEHITIFLMILPTAYYDSLIGHFSASFTKPRSNGRKNQRRITKLVVLSSIV